MKNSKHFLALPCLALLPLALFSFKSPKISDSGNALNKLSVVEMAQNGSTEGIIIVTSGLDNTKSLDNLQVVVTVLIETKATSTDLIELNDNS